MNKAVQKGSRCDNDGFPVVKKSRIVRHTLHRIIFDDESFHERLPDVKILLAFHHLFHRQAIELFVALHTGGLDGGPL